MNFITIQNKTINLDLVEAIYYNDNDFEIDFQFSSGSSLFLNFENISCYNSILNSLSYMLDNTNKDYIRG
jgi:hypothetical protein